MSTASRALLSWKSLTALVAVVAIAAGLVVTSRWLDERSDRRRPMYKSVIEMQELQYDLLAEGKQPKLVRLHPKSPPVKIGDTLFKPAPNVTVLVEERDGETCVQGNNQFHDRTTWLCIDPEGGRPTLGGLQ